MLEGIVNGTEIVLYLSGDLSVLSTSLSWNVNHSTRDTTCREGNNWKTFIAGDRSWEVSCDNGFAFRNSDGTLYTSIAGEVGVEEIFENYIRNQEIIDIKITRKGNLNNEYRWLGKAFITGLEVNAPNEDNTTYSFNLRGCNRLTVSTLGPST
tara:strand:- start:42 stop:500 length:459 start_codon:yes stop_codon:yes gene_type:complete